ncbi:MAG TPA: phage tail protein I [Ktedonobacteraceae bacterium]|nr:phage tail protein I [Ktedonobacteraceae bacterium]
MLTQTAQLIVQLQGAVIQTVPLNVPVLRIGRAPESGLMLDNHMISRNHAEIRSGPQGAVLTDLGSSNGTFIGDQRLLPNQPHLLTDGASFRIGPYLLIYRAAAEQEQGQEEDEGMLPIPEQATLPPEIAVEAAQTRNQISPLPRPEPPAPRKPERGRSSLYTRYLPDIYQENDFLQRFLSIFEDIWEPLEQRQDHIEMYFDPRTCPVSFLPWLASWLDIPLNPHWPEARKRRLLSQAMELYSWRGTLYGLARMIEICTGLTPEITEVLSEPFVFHVRITLSSSPPGEAVDRALIEELIQTHKPAHAGYILEVSK